MGLKFLRYYPDDEREYWVAAPNYTHGEGGFGVLVCGRALGQYDPDVKIGGAFRYGPPSCRRRIIVDYDDVPEEILRLWVELQLKFVTPA